MYIFTLDCMILVLPADRSRADFQNIMHISCTSDRGQCGQYCCCFVDAAATATATASITTPAVFVFKYYVL
jgi:F0F1-type ATP synthase gamma subunit